ncbi:MAG: hypothetical protein KJZ54_10300 [Phycisphaerales bacterium]|nr:hypothetical protein [Phycisphaerales bacterium]
MKTPVRLLVSALTACALCSLALACYAAVDDEVYAIEDNGLDSSGIGWKSCGGWCGTSWFHISSCLNSQNCCGWYSCGASGATGQNVCCNSGMVCSDGRQTTPPSTPRCLTSGS